MRRQILLFVLSFLLQLCFMFLLAYNYKEAVR